MQSLVKRLGFCDVKPDAIYQILDALEDKSIPQDNT